ncbi:hypothetical protein GW17_00003687 [Ensete ventricosum]|nr:hypothetical protein GW17_00003687 [Ensete ventricosum]
MTSRHPARCLFSSSRKKELSREGGVSRRRLVRPVAFPPLQSVTRDGPCLVRIAPLPSLIIRRYPGTKAYYHDLENGSGQEEENKRRGRGPAESSI